eukprot:3992309-Prymnesium_polylepis.1
MWAKQADAGKKPAAAPSLSVFEMKCCVNEACGCCHPEPPPLARARTAPLPGLPPAGLLEDA